MARNFSALIAYLDGRFGEPFEWGARANDCVSFAAGGVHALTGRDLIAELGVTWSTRLGAQRVLRRVGGVAAAADLALVRIAPSAAHRGDIGFVSLGGRESLVIFEGETLAGPGPSGLVRLPRARAAIAWSAT